MGGRTARRAPRARGAAARGEPARQILPIARHALGRVGVVLRFGVALLGAGTSVGEMAYLAPSPELRRHSTDVIVSQPCTTISFTPESLAQLSPGGRHRFEIFDVAANQQAQDVLQLEAELREKTAKAAKAEADADRTRAQTVNDNMTAAKSAMEAATAIVQMPTIAKVGDNLLLQGGWQGGDPTQGVPVAAQGLPALPQQPQVPAAPAAPPEMGIEAQPQ